MAIGRSLFNDNTVVGEVVDCILRVGDRPPTLKPVDDGTFELVRKLSNLD